jgi:RND superfamily putative drug exporter
MMDSSHTTVQSNSEPIDTVQPFGFTGKLASLSGRRPKFVLALWGVIFIAAVAIAAGLPADLTTEIELTNDPEAERAARMIDERLPATGAPPPGEYVVVQSDSLTVDDPEFQTYISELVTDLNAVDGSLIAQAVNPFEAGSDLLFSDDRSAAVIPVYIENVDADPHAFLDLLDERDRESGYTVVTGGQISIDTAFIETSEADLITGEVIGISVAMLVLIVVFGTLVAAGVPLVLAITAIAIAFGLTMLAGQVFELSVFVINMMIMIGLAVGIDYALFIIGRYREERAKGTSTLAAITRTGDTASKAVLFSGLTVVIALLGMLIVPSTLFKSLGLGAIVVVIVAVAATLTALPATLALIGGGIERGRGRALMGTIGVALLLFAALFQAVGVDRVFSIAYVVLAVAAFGLAVANIDPFHRRGIGLQDGGFWARQTRFVMRHPVVLVTVTGAALLALAAAYFTIDLGESGISTLPKDTPAYRAFTLLESEFSGISLESPNRIAIDGDVDDPLIANAIATLRNAIAADPAFGVITEETNPSGDLTLIRIPSTSDTRSSAAIESIERLRGDYIPAAFDGVGATVLVGGPTAYSIDFQDAVDRYTPIVFAFVLGVSFLLLLLAFRSLVVPLKSVLMNLLSVGASYGLLVIVFQHGWGNELFGFQQVERIDAWVPLMMFSILFGLSMDYHVFLLSRIREHFDVTHNNIESVSHGLRTTGSMITGAALIMVAVFGGFAMGELSMFQQMGFGLATAVILDATVIRSILVPASMRLLGDLNWYFPSWLEWLPKISVEGHPELESTVSSDFTVAADGGVAD